MNQAFSFQEARNSLSRKVKEFHLTFPSDSIRSHSDESNTFFRAIIGSFLEEIGACRGKNFESQKDSERQSRDLRYELFQDLYFFILEANCFTLVTSPELATAILAKITSIKETNKHADRSFWLSETEEKIYAHHRKLQEEYPRLLEGNPCALALADGATTMPSTEVDYPIDEKLKID